MYVEISADMCSGVQSPPDDHHQRTNGTSSARQRVTDALFPGHAWSLIKCCDYIKQELLPGFQPNPALSASLSGGEELRCVKRHPRLRLIFSRQRRDEGVLLNLSPPVMTWRVPFAPSRFEIQTPCSSSPATRNYDSTPSPSSSTHQPRSSLPPDSSVCVMYRLYQSNGWPAPLFFSTNCQSRVKPQ